MESTLLRVEEKRYTEWDICEGSIPYSFSLKIYLLLSTFLELTCDVAIVGGGISGIYMAYRLLETEKENIVCVFEKSDRLGGRIDDHFFKSSRLVPVGKLKYFLFYFIHYATDGVHTKRKNILF